MALCGLMTYLLTGEEPEGIDFIFPRVGGLNPDGSKRRITTMFYTREAPMLEKHIEEEGGGIHGALMGSINMLYNKMLFQPFVEMYTNRDYFGRDIYDVNAPEYRQAAQFMSKVFKDQFSPITLSGAQRALETGGTYSRDVPLALLGFGPAPSYAAKTATQNRIAYLYHRFVAPVSSPQPEAETADAKRQAVQAYRLAEVNKDQAKMNAALDLLAQTGGKVPSTAGDIYMFKRLPVSSRRPSWKAPRMMKLGSM